MLLALLLHFFSSVSAHGGMLWPPIWQDGVGLPIDQLSDHYVSSNPKVRDPKSGKAYWNTRTCPAHKDARPPGSVCGQERNRGTSSFGSDARFVEFPQMITTEWEIGSVQDVAWSSRGSHKGGYTYRLCQLGPDGRPGISVSQAMCFRLPQTSP